MGTRLVARVSQTGAVPPVGHFRGMPPELTGGADERERLPSAHALLLEEEADGIFLLRFTQDGACVGDTWHMSIEEAKEQAEYEYGDSLGTWRPVPSDLDDPVAYALELT